MATESFLGIHGTALALREQRLQLLAGNIANADLAQAIQYVAHQREVAA